MKFASPYNATIPDQDILTYLFSVSKFRDEDTIWIEGDHPEQSITLSVLRRLVGEIGQGLRNLGVGATEGGSDIVLSFVENQIMIAPVVFGILCAQGVHSTSSPLATSFELARQLSLTKPKVLICSPQTSETAQEALRRAGLTNPPKLIEMNAESLDIITLDKTSILRKGSLQWAPITDPEVLRNRTACLIFSSGTTGIPKGVELSHANIVANLCQMGYFFGPRADQIRREGGIPRMAALLQNSVAVGVLVHSFMALQHGMQTIMMKKYDFETLTQYNNRYNLTVFFLAPPIWNRIVSEWPVEKCQKIRWALSGGSPMPVTLQRRVNKVLPRGTYLLPNWGMTELVCGATQFPPDEEDIEGSVGRLIPGMEAIVVDANGNSLSSGSSGELLVKGPNVMRRYYKNEAATENAFNEAGWFRTGDKATIKTDGRIFIEGRYKELIKYKGNQVSPVELESVICQHPAVVDVGVIGVRLANGDELPRAYVVPGRNSTRCTEQEIIDWVKPLLSNHKQLRGGVALVEEIPRNLNGKIMRNILSDWAEAEKMKTRVLEDVVLAKL